jgi:molybdopterin molybdotransferase
MKQAGVEILAADLGLKPGRACAIGIKGEKLIFGLSGNPPAAMTVFSLLSRPCLRKLSGYAHPGLRRTKVTLLDSFNKNSQNTRIISGWLDITDGVMRMKTAAAHGHAVMHALVGCEVLAVIPAGSPPLPAGTVLEAYLLN